MPESMAAAISLTFDGVLTLQHAEAFRDRLLEALAGGSAVEVDCSAATEVDLSFIQVLLATRRAALAAGKSFSLTGPAGGALAETLIRAGFVTEDGLPPLPDEVFWTRKGGAR